MAVLLDRLPRGWSLVAWALGGAGLLAIAAFDLAPPLAYNDDWVMAWSVRHLVVAHSLVPFPAQSAIALVQTVWAAIVTLGHPDQRWLRLSLLPFVVLAAISSYRLARALGADGVWSAIAGVTLLASPLFMTLATSFMTDVPSVALLLAATTAAVAWLERRAGIGWVLAFSLLAVLERQTNVLIPVALGATMLVARPLTPQAGGGKPSHPPLTPQAGGGKPSRPALTPQARGGKLRDLLALFAVVGLGALLPAAVGIAPATQEHWLAGILNLEWGRLAPVTLVGPLLGLFLLPFSVALLYRPATSGSVRIAWVAPVGLAAIAFVASALRFSSTGSIFPGNVFTPEGFGLTLGGIKPPVFPSLVFALWTLGVLATIYVLLVHRRALWVSRQLPVAQLFVVIAAVSQFAFLFLLHRQIYDRYFLPVVALLIPLVAAWASHTTRPRLAAGWAMVVLAVGVGAYLVGEQDYAAWQSARDQVARAAYRLAPANDVNAGYEANGTYVVIPTYGSSGVMLENLAVSDQPAGFGSLGPAHPRIVLRFASPGDPRPGVNYQSLNPGRIVMEVPQ